MVGKSHKFLLVLLVAATFLISGCSRESEGKSVLTEEAAVAEARKAWISIYEKTSGHTKVGKEDTDKFEPYVAVLEGDDWIVRGTLPAGFHGVVFETHVSRSNGSVRVEGTQK